MIQIVNMHIYTVFTLTIKLQEILLSSCREVAMTNCFSGIYIFNLAKFFCSKVGITPRKITESEILANRHIFITT